MVGSDRQGKQLRGYRYRIQLPGEIKNLVREIQPIVNRLEENDDADHRSIGKLESNIKNPVGIDAQQNKGGEAKGVVNGRAPLQHFTPGEETEHHRRP